MRVIVVVLVAASVASAQPTYVVQELIPLPGLYPIATVHDVSSDGRAVGRTWKDEGGFVFNHHAVLWSADGQPQDLGDDGVWSEAFGISATGYVAGRHDVLGALWTGRTRQPLPPLPGGLGSQAFDVDDAGVAVGVSYVDGGTIAVRWTDGVAEALTGANTQSWAFEVNGAGQAVGRRDDLHREAMLWEGDGFTVLPDLGESFASATNISEGGIISGGALDESQRVVPILWAAGTFAITRLPEPADAIATNVWDVNDDGLAVGQACLSFDCESSRAVLWEGGNVHDLNDLIPADSGWTLSTASAISENGEIVGSGGFPEGGPSIRAFKLTPVLTDVGDLPVDRTGVVVTPNPLRGSAEIRFASRHDGPATLRVHDLAGRLVASRVFERLPAGAHAMAWRDLVGSARLPSGVYLLRVARPGESPAAVRVAVLR